MGGKEASKVSFGGFGDRGTKGVYQNLDQQTKTQLEGLRGEIAGELEKLGITDQSINTLVDEIIAHPMLMYIILANREQIKFKVIKKDENKGEIIYEAQLPKDNTIIKKIVKGGQTKYIVKIGNNKPVELSARLGNILLLQPSKKLKSLQNLIEQRFSFELDGERVWIYQKIEKTKDKQGKIQEKKVWKLLYTGNDSAMKEKVELINNMGLAREYFEYMTCPPEKKKEKYETFMSQLNSKIDEKLKATQPSLIEPAQILISGYLTGTIKDKKGKRAARILIVVLTNPKMYTHLAQNILARVSTGLKEYRATVQAMKGATGPVPVGPIYTEAINEGYDEYIKTQKQNFFKEVDSLPMTEDSKTRLKGELEKRARSALKDPSGFYKFYSFLTIYDASKNDYLRKVAMLKEPQDRKKFENDFFNLLIKFSLRVEELLRIDPTASPEKYSKLAEDILNSYEKALYNIAKKFHLDEDERAKESTGGAVASLLYTLTQGLPSEYKRKVINNVKATVIKDLGFSGLRGFIKGLLSAAAQEKDFEFIKMFLSDLDLGPKHQIGDRPFFSPKNGTGPILVYRV